MQTALAAALVGGVCLLAWANAASRTSSVRLGLLLGGVGLAFGVASATVGLSAARQLRGAYVLGGWCCAALVLSALLWRQRRALLALLRDRWSKRPALRSVDTALLAGVAALVLVMLLVAVVAVPNNWDSMTYHLSRVEQWRVRRSVGAYATTDSRENWSGPLAEYGLLHLRLLSGGDRLANCLQWTALVHAASSASWLAARLGANRRAQIAVLVMAVSAPTVVSEASTTQNDLACAAATLATVALLVREMRSPRPFARGWALSIGAAAGLALLTKATAVPLLLPFVAWFVWSRRSGWPVLLRGAVVAAALAGALNASHVHDNLHAYGSLTGPTAITANSRLGPDVVIANAVRYTTMNLATPQWQVNRRLQDTVEGALTEARIDPNDRADTFQGTRFRITSRFQEDVAVSLLSVGLFLALTVLSLERGPMRSAFGGVGICVVLGFLAFCATVAWQPWGMRLLVPTLVLMAVPLGQALVSSPTRTSTVVLLAALVCATPWATGAALRPLSGPRSVLVTSASEQRFAARPALRNQMDAAADLVASMHIPAAGVVRHGNDWEYPLWARLREDGSATVLWDVVPDPEQHHDGATRVADALICLQACTVPSGWQQRRTGSDVVVAWRP